MPTTLHAEVQRRLPFADQALPDRRVILDNCRWIRYSVRLQRGNHLLNKIAGRCFWLGQNRVQVHFVQLTFDISGFPLRWLFALLGKIAFGVAFDVLMGIFSSRIQLPALLAIYGSRVHGLFDLRNLGS